MVSGVVPVLYAAVQAIVEYLPSVPALSGETELPLSIIDGFTRAYLLCNLIPPAVTQNQSSIIASSPWTLLMTSLVSNDVVQIALALLVADTNTNRSQPMAGSSSLTCFRSFIPLLWQCKLLPNCKHMAGRL